MKLRPIAEVEAFLAMMGYQEAPDLLDKAGTVKAWTHARGHLRLTRRSRAELAPGNPWLNPRLKADPVYSFTSNANKEVNDKVPWLATPEEAYNALLKVLLEDPT